MFHAGISCISFGKSFLLGAMSGWLEWVTMTGTQYDTIDSRCDVFRYAVYLLRPVSSLGRTGTE